MPESLYYLLSSDYFFAYNMQHAKGAKIPRGNKPAIAAEKEPINDDVVFEIELIKQVEINVDYILMLVDKYRRERGDGDDKEIRAEITRAVDASPSLRNKKDLIEEFVDRVTATGEIDEEWQAYVDAKRTAELDAIIRAENLKPAETKAFVEHAFATV